MHIWRINEEFLQDKEVEEKITKDLEQYFKLN